MLECWKVFKIIETLTTATDKAATKKTQLIKKQQRKMQCTASFSIAIFMKKDAMKKEPEHRRSNE